MDDLKARCLLGLGKMWRVAWLLMMAGLWMTETLRHRTDKRSR